jgi:hypothetical protein
MSGVTVSAQAGRQGHRRDGETGATRSWVCMYSSNIAEHRLRIASSVGTVRRTSKVLTGGAGLRTGVRQLL